MAHRVQPRPLPSGMFGPVPRQAVYVITNKSRAIKTACLQALSMHLVGQLSNPAPKLKAILDLSRSGVKPKEGRARPSPRELRRLGNGVVQRAIMQVLRAADEPMRTGEIQAGVERLLGHPVAKESVSWSLRTGSRGDEPRFEQVAYATYRLRWSS